MFVCYVAEGYDIGTKEIAIVVCSIIEKIIIRCFINLS